MSTDTPAVDWAAALADIETRITKLQSLASNIRELMMAGGGASPTVPTGGGPGGGIRPDAFLGMTILSA